MGRQSKSRNEKTLVSLDIGNGYVKVRAEGAGVAFPSICAVMSQTLDGFDFAGSGDDFVIGYRGVKYAIGETVHYKGLTPITIAHRSRLETEFYRVMFAAGLARVLDSDADLEVVVSLPPAAYWDKAKQKAVLSGVYETIHYNEHGPRACTFTVDASDIRVIPEGAGALFSMALDEHGRECGRDFLGSSSIGVVDVGTYTTDLILLESLKLVRSRTTSMPHALHGVHERLISFASSIGVDLDLYRADDTLRKGYFTRLGERRDFSREREDWIGELTRAISAQIRTTWNGGNDAEHIIIAGGGAPLVEKALQMEFPQVSLIESVEPFFANCEGGYRYGMLRRIAQK